MKEKQINGKVDVVPGKQAWERMELRFEGDSSELIQAGGGKSGIAADPGDILKPPGQDTT